MSKKPVIAVTGPQRGGLAPWLMTWLAIFRAGGKALRITPADDQQTNNELRFDGLVIGGGSDIHPSNYGEELATLSDAPQSSSLRDRVISLLVFLLRGLLSIKLSQPGIDPDRDQLEMSLCRLAMENNLPVLGICRGAQLLNITQGGSLFQDTSDLYTETPQMRTLRPLKMITIAPDSRLASILDSHSLRVNSLHNQAVNQLGDDLTISARDSNGIVQAIEHPAAAFVIGVQWHPEYLPQSRSHQKLFKVLVKFARGEQDEQQNR